MSKGEDRVPTRRIVLVLGLLLGVVMTAALLRLQADRKGNNVSSTGQGNTTAANGLIGEARSIIAPGQDPEDESEILRSREEYFRTRYGLPEQQIDNNWLVAAEKQVARMQSGIPAGKISYDRSQADSPLALDPGQLISLGPRPGQSDPCASCFKYGLVSGRINSIAIHPTITSTVYLGVSNGGVWKTTTCCTLNTQWYPTTDDPSIGTQTIDEVTLDPNNPNIVYAATGDFRATGAARGSNGILKSTDAGASWTVLGQSVFPPFRNGPFGPGQPIGGSSQYQAVSAIKVDPNNSNTLIAGTKYGFYMSYDAGTNWTGPCFTNPYTQTITISGGQHEVRQDNTEILVRKVNTTTTFIYYAIGGAFNNLVGGGTNGANGIYTATLTPTTTGCPSPWTLITRGDNGWPAGTGDGQPGAPISTTNKPGRIDVAIAPRITNPITLTTLYAAAATSASGPTPPGPSNLLGIYRSTDDGLTWSLRATTDSFKDCNGGPGIQGQANYDQTIEVDPRNHNILYYGEVDVFKSIDGGLTWFDTGCVYTGGTWIHPDQHDFRYMPNASGNSSALMLYANDGGIWFTNQANSALQIRPNIISLNKSLNTMEFYNGQTTGNFATSAEPGANGGTQDNGSFVNIWEGGQASLGPEQWDLRLGGDGFFAAIEPVNNQIWYQTNNRSQMVRSTL
ncbi:MAG TPA: hypothetical protein VEY08_08275, partial [Chloroflexia bacterium]|nr:hypothetical protein [Chloroflexia bacterium]